MDELIRSKMHEALEVEQPAGDLRFRILSSLPVAERPARRFHTPSFRWAGGFVAVLLAVAVVAGLLFSRGYLGPYGSANNPAARSNPAGSFGGPVSMMSPTTGWADTNFVNGHPKHTTDGGLHWTDVSPPSVIAGGVSSDYFLDATHAWVVEASWGARIQFVSLRTTDGGRTWQQGTPGTFADSHTYTVDELSQGGLRLDFLDPAHGWLFIASIVKSPPSSSVSHFDTLYRTIDGGLHWTLVSTNAWSFAPAPFTIGCPWGSPVFISLSAGFMYSPDRTYELGQTSQCPVPDRPALHVTDDGGATWQFQVVPLPTATCANLGLCVVGVPDFVDQLHGFLTLWMQSGSILLATSDGGSSWSPRSMPGGPSDQSSIAWLDARNGWAWTSYGPLIPPPATDTTTVRIYRTRDGGATWVQVQTDLQYQTVDGPVGALYFVDQTTGFTVRWRCGVAVAVNEPCVGSEYNTLIKTTDGGLTWKVVARVT